MELLIGVGLDLAIGDPQWLPHPVRGIGWLAKLAERVWRSTHLPLRWAGFFFWISVVGISGVAVWMTLPWGNIYWIYALLACRDLDIEAGRVVRALHSGDTQEARTKLSWIVGRDTAMLEEPEILRATVETVAENLSDGVIAPLFYLALAGPVGMAVYKAINTLDSMVGHKNNRYIDFGMVSARMDDIANFIPARITALLIWIAALLPGFYALRALQVTIRDGANQPSPNSGYPEAAVAGALGVQLGGINFYGGVPCRKPNLGDAFVPLQCGVFRRVQILLYASEAIFVCAMVGLYQWL